MIEDIISFRHDLHSHPELSAQEFRTRGRIAAYLKKMNPARLYEHSDGFGVVAVFGSEKEKALAFRADIDALPIQENCSLEYVSQKSGVAHKCGHDGHTSILLRFAELLSESNLSKTVILIFQPEEETGSGSKKILSSGILDKYDIEHIYALHNIPGYKKGRLVFKYGTFTAASVGIIIHLQGRSTHAAFPEKGLNPAMAVAEILRKVLALNTNPDDVSDSFRQVTPISVRLGHETFGTSAGDADVMFTLRAYTNKGMDDLKSKVVKIAETESAFFNLKSSISWKEAFNAIENRASEVDRLIKTADKNKFDYQKIEIPFRWSEDFADYLTKYSGAFFGIGSGEDSVELHHPDYNFPDDIIETAANFFFKLSRE